MSAASIQNGEASNICQRYSPETFRKSLITEEERCNAMNEKLVFTVKEAAEMLCISAKTCYDLTHKADFPAIEIGYRTVISREGLREWVRNQEQNRTEAI